MKIRDFKLECYFGEHEFTAPYLLTQSDCESMTIGELLAMEPGAKEELLNLRLGYTETYGDPELRSLISELYADMKKENVLVCHGAQEAVFAYMNVMLEPGDHMIVMFPNYQSLYEIANSVPGCEYSKWMLKDTGRGWELNFEELERLIRPNTKLLVVSTPNNPTGYTFTNAEIRQLCEICRKHDLYLFADEVYHGTEMDGERRGWVADSYEKAVSLGVLSKSYGLAGLRVGWLVGKDTELLEKVVRYKHYLSICDAAPSEFLAKVALKHGEEILERNRALIRENVRSAREFFERYTDLFEERPAPAGPIAFHRLKIDLPAEEFCRRAIEKKGVLLMPATMFDVDMPYFRMGYGRTSVPESLKKFEEFLIEEGYAKR